MAPGWTFAAIVAATAAACGGEVSHDSADGGSEPGDSGTGPLDASSGSSQQGDAPQEVSTADSGADTGPEPDAAEDAGALIPDFAWYRLDETSGTTAHDSSTNHYDITNLAGVTWSQGASFDSSVGVCGWTSVATNMRQPPLTISAWQTPAPRADSTSNDYCYEPFTSNGVSGDVAGSSGYGLGINVWTDGIPGGALTVETGQLGCVNGSFTTLGSFAANQEYFVVLAVTATTATIYVDGASLTSLPAAAPPAASPALLWLGCVNDDVRTGSKRFFNGRMRDVRVYTRQLAATEVQQLYADGPSP